METQERKTHRFLKFRRGKKNKNQALDTRSSVGSAVDESADGARHSSIASRPSNEVDSELSPSGDTFEVLPLTDVDKKLNEDHELHVQVSHAHGLMAMDTTGTSDPYCVVHIGGSSHRTSTVKRNLHPVWNETFVFRADDVREGNGVIKLRLWDADDWSKDDFLGQAVVNLYDTHIGDTARQLDLDLKPSQGFFKTLRGPCPFGSSPAAVTGCLTVMMWWSIAMESTKYLHHPTKPSFPVPVEGEGKRIASSLCTPPGVTRNVPAVIHSAAGSLYEEPCMVYLNISLKKVVVSPPKNADWTCLSCKYKPPSTATKAVRRLGKALGVSIRDTLSFASILRPIARRPHHSRGGSASETATSEAPDTSETSELPGIRRMYSPGSEFLDAWSKELDKIEWANGLDSRPSSNLPPRGESGDVDTIDSGSGSPSGGPSGDEGDDSIAGPDMEGGKLLMHPYWYFKMTFGGQNYRSKIIERVHGDLVIKFHDAASFVSVLPLKDRVVHVKVYMTDNKKQKGRLMFVWNIKLFDLLDNVEECWAADGSDGLTGDAYTSCKLVHTDNRSKLYNIPERQEKANRDYRMSYSTGSSQDMDDQKSGRYAVSSSRPDNAALKVESREVDLSQKHEKWVQENRGTSPSGSPNAPGVDSFLGRLSIYLSSIALENPVDCFCVIKCGPHWCRTNTHLADKTVDVRWDIKLPVYDPASIMSLAVFNEQRGRVSLVGKLRFRICTMGPGRLYHCDLPIRSGGTATGIVYLSMKVHYPSATILSLKYFRPAAPNDVYHCGMHAGNTADRLGKESRGIILRWLDGSSPRVPDVVARRVLDLETMTFSRKRMRVHLKRIKNCLLMLGPASTYFAHIRQWENPIESVACITALCFAAYYPEWLVFFLLLGAAFFFTLVYRVPVDLPTMTDPILILESSTPSTQPKDLANPYTALKARYDQLQTILVSVQNIMDHVASFAEKLETLVTWRDPTATRLLTLILLIAALFVHVFGLKVFLCLGVVWVFRPPGMRDALPSPPVNFFTRLPSKSDQML